MQPPYIPYYHPSMVWLHHYMEDFESPNKKCPSCIRGRLKSSVHARRNMEQGEIQELIEKYEMKFHGCPLLSCMGEAWFDIQVLEERLHEPPLWVKEFIVGNMDDHILYGSAIKCFYSFMDWMRGYITKMETKGCASLAHNGKSFLCICSRFKYAYDIFIL